MSEIRNGLRNFLAVPFLYDTFQLVVGAIEWRRRFATAAIVPALVEGDAVLDVGCGTGELLQWLPSYVEYHGFDRNESYIATAKRRFSKRNANFYCADVGANTGHTNENARRYNAIFAIGLLHHLDDAEAKALLDLCARLLLPGGRVFLLDPVYVSGQSFASKYIVSMDRGQNVRSEMDYVSLCASSFVRVQHAVELWPLRIPYSGITAVCNM